MPCAYPLLKSRLRASVKMAFLGVRISVQKDPCVHPFQKTTLACIRFQVTKKIYIRIRTSETLVFTTGVLQEP